MESDMNLSDAYRVGFKAGFDQVLTVMEDNHKQMIGEGLFDETTLNALGIVLGSLRKLIDEHPEVVK